MIPSGITFGHHVDQQTVAANETQTGITMPTATEKMHALKTSCSRPPCDSCTLHFEFFIETIPAKGKKPEHDVVKIKCTHCEACFYFSAWVRGRAHLAGNATIALANSTAACGNVQAQN